MMILSLKMKIQRKKMMYLKKNQTLMRMKMMMKLLEKNTEKMKMVKVMVMTCGTKGWRMMMKTWKMRMNFQA